MPDFTVVHASNIHLDSPLTGLAKRDPESPALVLGATCKAFVNIVELARTGLRLWHRKCETFDWPKLHVAVHGRNYKDAATLDSLRYIGDASPMSRNANLSENLLSQLVGCSLWSLPPDISKSKSLTQARFSEKIDYSAPYICWTTEP